MARIGPDSRRSWIVAVACFFVQVLTFGLTEASGLLFVATIEKFSSRREQASLPFTLAYCVRSAIGPFVSYLGQKFGIRQVTLFGAVLSAISVGTCFFANDIIDLTLLWGLVFGFSLGMETSMLNVILNEHFIKHRVKANGLNISGASLGTLLLSPLIENSVEAYGLSGTFLIIAGLMLNSIPACVVMLLNMPAEDDPSSENKSPEAENNIDMIKCDNNSLAALCESTVIYKSIEKNNNDKNTKTDCLIGSYKKRNSDFSEINRTPSVILDVSQLPNASKNYNHIENNYYHWFLKMFSSSSSCHIKSYKVHAIDVPKSTILSHPTLNGEILKKEPKVIHQNGDLPNGHASKELLYVNKVDCENHHEPSVINDISSEASSSSSSKWKIYLLFCQPIYIVLVIGSGIYYFSITTFLTIIVDHATDIGISLTYSTYLVMWIAVSDMFGYFTLSWIIERCKISQIKFAAFSYLGLCLICIAIVWCQNYIVLLVLITVFEFSQCGVIVLCAPIVAELIEEDLQATAIASVTIMSSPITMAIAPIIGYFRDGGGSYDGVFYVMSAATFFCCILFLFLPILERRRDSRRSTT
ncbi:uncharacterized protein LOC129989278 isoform X2 [Argiope bruennichi]|uniref:Monocarboxylate transporter 9 like protein n=2 Tax=Argiope bruennichi TaxID=94029 RepID=A0A8T0ED95_ARGBR|nr:uncharacterized protein LOC129989278 isoform X2 [Argiope bruennichi]XP_055953677.1 uncharacterized protein LOC129989278 isoform X2 [Argiope bruennichi]KAF8770603.1 Monocarboxylate transporter 9 like protein [Argiope bruennichi]